MTTDSILFMLLFVVLSDHYLRKKSDNYLKLQFLHKNNCKTIILLRKEDQHCK